MVMKDSRPVIYNNRITENEGIGLYLRDVSKAEVKDNQVGEFVAGGARGYLFVVWEEPDRGRLRKE